MKTITTTINRVEMFYGSCGYVGKNIGVFPSGVTKEEIKEMLAKYKVVLIRSRRAQKE